MAGNEQARINLILLATKCKFMKRPSVCASVEKY
jgi:hypothetical protein